MFLLIFCAFFTTKNIFAIQSQSFETTNGAGAFEIYIGPSFRIYDVETIARNRFEHINIPVAQTTYEPWNRVKASVDFGMVGKIYINPIFYGFIDGGMRADGLYGGYFHLGFGFTIYFSYCFFIFRYWSRNVFSNLFF